MPTPKKTTPKRKGGAKKGERHALGNKGGPGVPSKYKPEFVERVYGLALLGATDKRMAEILDISPESFSKYKVQHKEFREAILKGKDDADAEVAKSLYSRAIGFEYKEYKTTYNFEEDPDSARRKRVKVGEVVTTKRVIPDVTACIFWLKNRQRLLWRDVWNQTDEESIENAAEFMQKVAKLLPK